jgi:pimeloyl-ACP methyl ester carboxylesterase
MYYEEYGSGEPLVLIHGGLAIGSLFAPQIALELGMHYPDLIRCMVVGAAWYRFSQSYQSLLKAMGFESPNVVNIEKMKQLMPEFTDMLRAWHSTIHGPDHWKTLATQISTMWWTPLNYTADDFQKIKIPTLILAGDRDPMIPVEEAVEMFRYIQGAELAIVPNSDHSLPRARAKLFSTIVLDFLLRHSTQTK